MIRRVLAILGVLLLWTAATASGATEWIPGLDRRLQVGERVEVKLKRSASGFLVADEIEIKERGDTDIELRGDLTAVDASDGALEMVGFRVTFDERTEILHDNGEVVEPESLVEGQRVRVDGELDDSGRLYAEKIRVRRNQGYREQKVEAVITALIPRPAPTMRVAGLEVRIGEATELTGLRGRARPALQRRLGFVDDDDIMFGSGRKLGGRISIAGEVRLRLESFEYAELDPELDDRELTTQLSGVIGAAADFGRVFAYLEAAGGREFFIESLSPFDEPNSNAFISQAYVEVQRAGAPWLSVAVGRQKFDEEREWLYNAKNLDGIRLTADFFPWTLEASVSRDIFDESRNLRDQEKTNTMVRVSYEASEDLQLEAHYIRREDRAVLEQSPKMFTLRALGEPGKHLEFWADLAMDRGSRGSLLASTGQVLVRPVDAYAADVGLTYHPRVGWDPSFTVSYAVGSGEPDLDPDDLARTDERTFRQTDLERNRWRFNGVVSFRYYGEVFDPELTNLRVGTVGFGLRPLRPFSIDLIYHRYRQDVASRRIRGADIEANPSGLDPHLGEEVDLIIGYEPSRKYELRLNAGWFLPGRAFSDDARVARSLRFQAKFRF